MPKFDDLIAALTGVTCAMSFDISFSSICDLEWTDKAEFHSESISPWWKRSICCDMMQSILCTWSLGSGWSSNAGNISSLWRGVINTSG
eukprot:7262943-Ditylum_brightwellii.AAC.1